MVEARLPGLNNKDAAEHEVLLESMTPILERMSIHKDEEDSPTYRALWDQLDNIKSQLSVLRGEETYVPPPRSLATTPLTLENYVSPSVTEKETKASNSQEGRARLQREAGPSVPFTASAEVRKGEGGGRKKNGRKGAWEGLPPLKPVPKRPKRERGSLNSLNPLRVSQGPARGQEKSPL